MAIASGGAVMGDDRRGRLRIATWNLERVSLRSWLKLPRLLRQIEAVDADVWVMTESRVGLPLSDAYPFVVHAPAHASRRPDTDERWVSIWSRYPLADAGVVASPWDAAACGFRSNPITRFAPIRSVVSEVSDHPAREAVSALT